jgi:hypothetical protein
MAIPTVTRAAMAAPTTGRDNPNIVSVDPNAPRIDVVVVIPTAAMDAAVSPVCKGVEVCPNPPIPLNLHRELADSLCECAG